MESNHSGPCRVPNFATYNEDTRRHYTMDPNDVTDTTSGAQDICKGKGMNLLEIYSQTEWKTLHFLADKANVKAFVM